MEMALYAYDTFKARLDAEDKVTWADKNKTAMEFCLDVDELRYG